jgi:hypothetical protein
MKSSLELSSGGRHFKGNQKIPSKVLKLKQTWDAVKEAFGESMLTLRMDQ